MSFVLPKFTPPDFSTEIFKNSREIRLGEVTKNGVAPSGFYLTSHMPAYYNHKNCWIIPKRNSQNCVAVLE